MFLGLPNFDAFEEELMEGWSEDQKKEREVVLSNRYGAFIMHTPHFYDAHTLIWYAMYIYTCVNRFVSN